MSGCLFCRIINGEIASRSVFSDDNIVAFKDLNPQAPTHILIVPRKHISSLSEAGDGDAQVLGELQLAGRTIAADLKLEGFRLVLNNGKIAGQTVDHIHYHLLAGRRLMWPPG